MWAAALALLLQAGALPPSDTNDAENWACAGPLIEKNYQQPVASRQLALRIADECTRPYRPESTPGPAGELLEQMRRNLHQTQASTFILDIDSRILQARRRDAITLKR